MCHPDPKTLRYRAEELRTLADDMHPETKEILLRCARDYERWAESIERIPA